MKQVGVVLILLLSVLSPLAAGEEIFEQSDHLLDYSRNVQIAFERCEILDHDGAWLVVSEHLDGTPTLLENAVLIQSNPTQIKHMLSTNEIEAACPQTEKQQLPRWVPNDPKFGDQWHLQNTGQTNGLAGEDANLTGAWESYLGTGVTIGIVDDGLDRDHPDLSTNYDNTNDWDFCGNDGNPTPSRWDAHGTAAAGVAAATGDNNVGVSGSAPDANLAGLQLISCGLSDTRESNALNHENQIIDIYSNSWGPSDSGSVLDGPGPLVVAAFEDDVANGRGGLGNIITWAAGNGYSSDDSNKDGYANARQTIAVSAVTHQGTASSYSEPGANILIAAHSDGSGEGITTTDIEGSDGYTSNDYTDDFGGTSSATPLASGVIALILEANANLTWRDVQHVLVNSARQNHANHGSWNVNGAGHDVSHQYGFGTVDAGRATQVAENWTNVDPAINITSGTLGVNTAIPDAGGALTDTVSVNDGLRIEHVEVIVDIEHDYRGDLEVILTSPSGTQSVLCKQQSDSGNDYSNWMFSTVHNWDEYSTGNWTLTVEDVDTGTSGTWNDWELIIHGVPIVLDSDGDGLTDENETDVYGTDPHDIDTDDDDLTDFQEIWNTSTDPLDADSDDDTLLDGAEVNIYGTNPLSNDTDGDGLTDAQEILFYGTDPLVYDPDADSDTWYHFEDCNDTNPDIHPAMTELLNGIDDDCDEDVDEGFSIIDSDNDGLDDYSEYYTHLTNLSNPDTDGDGLSDGDEVLTHGTDPLVPDADADEDGWYWFEDCNETDMWIHPDAVELLDGIDNDCDEDVDEDFRNQDSDGDGLLDLLEFNLFLTDPFDDDTDDDGLFDGEEINVTFTDPLVPDLDADGDGFRWFEECDDNNSARSPDHAELWNWIDDNCNDIIDEGVNRNVNLVQIYNQSSLLNQTEHIAFSFTIQGVEWDLEALYTQGANITWILAGPMGPMDPIHNALLYDIPAIDCADEVNFTDQAAFICARHNQTVGPWSVTLQITDGGETFARTANYSYEVWNPPPPPPPPEPEPEPLEEEGDEEQAGGLAKGQEPLIIALAATVVLLILIVLVTGRKKAPPPPPRPRPRGLPKMTDEFFR
jgi:subtilisin-like proprotein convertase family protein